MTIENARLDDARLGTAIRKKWEFSLWLYEHFYGNNGAGLGASHQTGWTGLVAKFIELFGLLDAEETLGVGKRSAFRSGAELVRKESSGIDENISDLLAQSTTLQQELWSEAVGAAETDKQPIMTGLFIESLNEVIDLHTTRVFLGLSNRIPITIWASLFLLIVLGMTSFGYQAGIAATSRSLEMPIFALAFAGVLYLIFDLDRAHEGLMQVNQSAMVDLYRSMQPAAPNT